VTGAGATTAEATGDAAAPAGVAAVSGGSRGLGRVLVERLLAQGWQVATFSRSPNEFTERTCAEQPERFWWQQADLEDLASLPAFVSGARRRFGRIDLLINNAAVLQRQELLLTLPPKKISSLISANLTAAITLTQACVKTMTQSGGGAVVNVSSINAVRGYRGVSVYAAAKAGMDGFTRSLARELGAFDIRVNSVVPGFFDSDMTAEVTDKNRERIQRRTPLGRLARIEEIADAALYLCSPGASFVTGQTIVVDGGITC
jgi:3-oxoacyl-[acyl-carrier protein] reductase